MINIRVLLGTQDSRFWILSYIECKVIGCLNIVQVLRFFLSLAIRDELFQFLEAC